MSAIFQKLKHMVTHIAQKFKLFPQAKKEGRPLAIKQEDALTFALYKQTSTRATKKSVYDDFGLKNTCSYKTFVVSVNRMALSALRILFFLMRMGRKDGHLVKLYGCYRHPRLSQQECQEAPNDERSCRVGTFRKRLLLRA
jgi:hypothetical protein